MITVLWCLLTMAATAVFIEYFEHKVERIKTAAHAQEIEVTNRLGKWYQARVAELENETRQLAEQVIASGSVVHHAMPLQPPEPAREYRSDPTGLYVEEVDPREYAE